MKYAIELTNKQKAQMDCMMEIVHRYIGFVRASRIAERKRIAESTNRRAAGK